MYPFMRFLTWVAVFNLLSRICNKINLTVLPCACCALIALLHLNFVCLLLECCMCVLYSLADFTLTRNKTDQEKYYTIPRNSEIGNVYKAVLQAKRPASTAGRFCPCNSCPYKVIKSPKAL